MTTTARFWAAVFTAGSATGKVENCLFENNASASCGGLAVISGGATIVRNNIITGNTGGGVMAVGAEMTAGYNNVWQNIGSDYVSMTASVREIYSLDPLFMDPAPW